MDMATAKDALAPSSRNVSRRMAKQQRADTKPELALRRLLHSRGYRYRVNWPVPGRARRTIDVAFPGRRVAIFIDGCFWHSCPLHATRPRANGTWWANKLDSNVARDRDTDSALEDAGWRVLRIWEHERPADVLGRIALELSGGSSRTGPARLREGGPRHP